MDYKDLLLKIFDRTVKDSFSVSREECIENGFPITKFSIKFKHVDEENDETYKQIKELLAQIVEDLTKKCQRQSVKH